MLPLTPFIGREKEFADIQRLLSQPDCRLLTLLGPGGTGKTRLAMEIESNSAKEFADGATVIFLEPLRSAEFFIPTIADTLGFSLSGQDSPVEQLSKFLAGRQTLLILDNFEHLLEAADDLMHLLHLTPTVKYLVTSREALNLQEEWLYTLTGLTFPEISAASGNPQTFDAIQLFKERALRVFPDFSLENEIDDVVKICQLVDGMPLALELAAAWRRSLRCQDIAAEIQHDLEFLTTRLRNVPERHRSIQAIFDQTWNQLSLKEQTSFKRLSVFRGGFQREAAQAVARASPPILSALVDRCLIRVAEDGRYFLHELLRQYAAEQLESNPDEEQQTQIDHARYFINFLASTLPKTVGFHQLETIDDIHGEIDNIRVAWLWSISRVDVPALRQGGAALGMYYQLSGSYVEGAQLFSQAADALMAQPVSHEIEDALIAILICRSWFSIRLGQIEKTEAGMKRCWEIYQTLGVPFRKDFTSDPVAFLGIISMIRGDFDTAETYATQAREVAEAENNPYNRQFAYKILSDLHLSQGRIDQGQKMAQKAFNEVQITGDEWFLAYILNNLGHIALIHADVSTAKTHFEASYKIRRAFNDPEMGVASNQLANIALQEQAYSEAEARFADTLTIYQKINDKGGMAEAYHGLGVASLAQEELEKSQSSLQAALRLGTAINYRAFLPRLLVDIASFLWKTGRQEKALNILSFAARHPGTNHETQTKAEQQLELYRLAISPSVYTQATQIDDGQTLEGICTALLVDLTLPIPPPAEPHQPTQSSQPLFDPLTERELEVLTLMAAGHSNPEIASELIISVGTVKGYTNKIFSKLGVRNRVEAITRARNIELI